MASGESFTVHLTGGGPWGFRLQGGADFGMPLQVAKVRKRSKADKAGVSENDVIVSIDGRDMTKSSHTDAMALIDAALRELKLVLRRDGGGKKTAPVAVVAAEPETSLNIVFSSDVSTSEPVTSYSESSSHVISSETFTDGFTISHSTSETKSDTTGGQTFTWHAETDTSEPVSHVSFQPADVAARIEQTRAAEGATTMQLLETKAPSGAVTMEVKETKAPSSAVRMQIRETEATSRLETTDVPQPVTMQVPEEAAKIQVSLTPTPKFNARALNAAPMQQPTFNVKVNKKTVTTTHAMMNGHPPPGGVRLQDRLGQERKQQEEFEKQEQFRRYEHLHSVREDLVKQREETEKAQHQQMKDIDYQQRQQQYQHDRHLLEQEKENIGGQPTFSVTKFQFSSPQANKWQPTEVPVVVKSVRPVLHQPMFNTPEPPPQPKPVYVETQPGPQQQYDVSMYRQHLVGPTPYGDDSQVNKSDLIRIVTKEVPLPHAQKTIRHIPGMIKPSSLDLVHTTEVFPEVSSPDKKKKLFSDSAFYDDPESQYPTIEEQVKLCHDIASSLEATANQRARGATMFAKRKNKARRWTIGTTGEEEFVVDGVDGYESEEDQPLFQFRIPKISTQVNEAPIKTYFNRTELETYKIKQQHDKMYGGSPISPENTEITSSLVADLHKKTGRGAKIFARRRERCENFVIDETNVRKAPLATPQANLSKKIEQIANPSKPYVSPWEAAVEDPFGGLNRAFEHLDKHKIEHKPPHVMPKPASIQPWKNTPLDTSYMTSYQPSQPVYTNDMFPDPAELKFADFNRKPKGWQSVAPPGGRTSDLSPSTAYAQSLQQLPPHQPTTIVRENSLDHNVVARGWGPPKPGDIAADYTRAPDFSRAYQQQEQVFVQQPTEPADEYVGYRQVGFRTPERRGMFTASTTQHYELPASDF